MEDELYSRTAAELVEMHNRLCPEGEALNGPWKASKRELIGRIRALGDRSTDDQAPETTEEAEERPKETVGGFVEAMLATEAAYADIARMARERFEGAQTTSRSVASVASVLRKRGVRVPFRRAGGHA